MGKYRKKPVIIDAIQFQDTKEGIAEALRFLGPNQAGYRRDSRTTHSWALRVLTLEGQMKCQPGDWLIRGIKGEFYPCKPDIFEATYELVDVQRQEEQHVS